MIQIVTGKLGAGKTLYCVMMMFDDLCEGLTVCTNIAVEWDELCKLAARLKGVVLDPRQLMKVNPERDRDWHTKIPWGTRKHPVKVYLDEIHLFFNARDWAKTATDSRSLLSFLTQSRKACVDCIFIAQEITTVEKQFRVLAEWELYCVNTDHMPLGILGKLPFKAFVVAVRDANQGFLVKRLWRSYDKRYFKLYGSFTFLDSEMQSLANDAEKREGFDLAKLPLWRRCWLNLVHPLQPLFSKP